MYFLKTRKALIIILMLFISLLLFSCSNETSITNGQSYRDTVLNYYSKYIDINNSLYTEMVFFKEKSFGNDYLILSHLYQGQGQSSLDLFVLSGKNGNYEIIKKSTGQEPLSMGFSVNRLIEEDKTILFGKFNSSTMVIKDASRKMVDYAKIEVIFKDGTIVEENVMQDNSYIIIADTTSEIDKMLLFNHSGEIEETLEDVGLNNVTFNDVK